MRGSLSVEDLTVVSLRVAGLTLAEIGKATRLLVAGGGVASSAASSIEQAL